MRTPRALDGNDVGELSALILSRLNWQQGTEPGVVDPLEASSGWLESLGVTAHQGDADCKAWLALLNPPQPRQLRGPLVGQLQLGGHLLA